MICFKIKWVFIVYLFGDLNSADVSLPFPFIQVFFFLCNSLMLLLAYKAATSVH